MNEEKNEKLKRIFKLDEVAEDGVYCVEPSEADLMAFAEHARKRIAEKEKHKQ